MSLREYKNEIRHGLRLFKPWRGRLILLNLLGLPLTVINVGLAWLIGLGVESIAKGESDWTALAPLLIVGIFLLRGLLSMLLSYARLRLESKVSLFFERKTFGKLLRIPLRKTPDLGATTTSLFFDGGRWAGGFTQLFATFSVEVIRAAALWGFLFFLDWRLGVLVGVVIPIFFLPFAFLVRRIRKASGEFFRRNQGYWSRAVDAARSPRLIRAFNAQEHEFRRFSEEGAKRRSTMLRYQLIQLFTGPLGELFGATALAAGLWLGESVIGGDVSLATVGSSAATLVWLLGSLRALFNTLSPLEITLVLQRRLRKLWDSDEEPTIEIAAPSLDGEFTVEGLSFAYDEAVFQNVSFSLRPGELVHLGGQSGVGKTTLARVPCRPYEPDSGRLLLDGKLLTDYSLANWRDRARLVSQEPEFMPGNLLETIAYPQQPDIEKARRLLALVQLDNLDAERVVSSGALELSGGERRRLALVRALYRKPDLLTLDEATSFVDEALEEELIQRLRQEYPRLMILLISHRPAAARLADRRLFLSHDGIQTI